MKKTLVRLLSVILAAVMVFPAAVFAEPYTDGALYCDSKQYNKQTLEYIGDVPAEATLTWTSDDTGIATVAQDADNPAKAIVTGVGKGTAHIEIRDKASFQQLQVWSIEVKERTPENVIIKTAPAKTSYVAGETFNPAGAVITVTYNTNETDDIKWGDAGLTCDKDGIALKMTDERVVFSYGNKTAEQRISVVAKEVFSVAIIDDKDEYTVGDVITGVEVLVTYNDKTTMIIKSGYTVTPSGKLTTDVKSYTVTYDGVTSAPKPITVKDKPAEGGGGSGSGGSGGGETTTEEYTLTAVTTALKKKSYNVGDTFDPDGLVVQVKNKKTGALVASLTGTTGTNALILDTLHVFQSSDIPTTTGTTKTIVITVWYNNKPYEVPVSGLTVTVPKKNLSVKTSGNTIRSLLVEMKNKTYPVGTTIGLSDIYRISGYDSNDATIYITYPDILEYGNLSLEVASVNNRGETSRKSASSRSRIDSGDVYTKATDEKVVYLRLYVDDVYYHEFEVSSGDPAVSVYTSSAYSSSYQIGTFDDLAEALDYVNDVNYQWGSTSSSVYSASRTLYLRLAEDANLNRYYVIPARNFEIDLNGHKLTMYTDSFRFRDRYDTYTATLSNTSSTTAKVSYTDLPADDLLVPLLDRSEKLVFKYQDSANANAPGIYTVTLADIKEGGTVTAKPAASTRNNVTTVTIAHGNDITFTVTPAKDFQIDTVKTKTGTSSTEQTVSVNTNTNYSVSSSTGVATYTMKDVKADATLTAAFKAVKKEEEKKEEQKPAETPWTNPFTDVRSTASYYDAVKYVNQNGLMDGMTTTSFGPDRTMTRAQFVTVLGRMFLGSLGVPNLETTNQKYESMLGTYGTVSQFTDVSNDDPTLKNWAVPYIIWAEKEGLVQGLGNGKFDPQGPITHQQMYIIMYRYAQYIAHQNINAATLPNLRATDANQIGEGWLPAAKEGAIAAAKYAQQQNFLVSTVVIDPAGFAVRSELATLLMQFSKNVLGWN